MDALNIHGDIDVLFDVELHFHRPTQVLKVASDVTHHFAQFGQFWHFVLQQVYQRSDEFERFLARRVDPDDHFSIDVLGEDDVSFLLAVNRLGL